MDCGIVRHEGTILGRGLTLGTDQRETHRNNNLLVVGAPGSGKSRRVIEPNIMQCNSSYVIVDPKGALREHLAPGLEAAGYEVGSLDFAHPEKSDVSWNPLERMGSEAEVQAFAAQLVSADGRCGNDPFWQQSAGLLLASYMLAVRDLPDRKNDLRGVMGLAQLAYEDARPAHGGDGHECRLDAVMASLAHGPAEVAAHEARIAEAEAAADAADAAYQDALCALAEAVGERPPEPLPRPSRRQRRRDIFMDPDGPFLDAGPRTLQYESIARGLARGACDIARASITGDAVRAAVDVLAGAARCQSRARDALREAEGEELPVRESEAYSLYQRVAANPARTWSCVLSTLAAAIDQWRDPALLDMLAGGPSAVDFGRIGDVPTALFVVVSDTSPAMYPLVGVFMSQLVDALVGHADASPEGRLEVPVRVVLDDFATMRGGAWASVDAWANATRSREIWWTIAIQGISQLAQMMDADAASSLIAACDAQVFVGAPNDQQTEAYLALRAAGARVPKGFGREPDPEAVIVRGYRPMLTAAYDPDTHPNRLQFRFERLMREAAGHGRKARPGIRLAG